VNVETKEKSKQWMHTVTKQAKKVYAHVACQIADGNCSLGQEKVADGRIHASRDYNNVRAY
jgi:hypothetical protein